MTTAEVLAAVKGLPRDHLYSWERQGYLCPDKDRRGGRDFRDYGERDLAKIRLMWKLCQQGYAPKASHDRAERLLARGNAAGRAVGGSLSMFYCGAQPLIERMRAETDFWRRRPENAALGARWADPRKKDQAGPTIPEESGVRFGPEELTRLAHVFLEGAPGEADAVVAASTTAALLVGAISSLAAMDTGRQLRPYVLERDVSGKTVLSGGKPASGLRVALVIDRLRVVQEIADYSVRLRVLGHELVSVFALLSFLTLEEATEQGTGSCSLRVFDTAGALASEAKRLLRTSADHETPT